GHRLPLAADNGRPWTPVAVRQALLLLRHRAGIGFGYGNPLEPDPQDALRQPDTEENEEVEGAVHRDQEAKQHSTAEDDEQADTSTHFFVSGAPCHEGEVSEEPQSWPGE